MMGLATKMDEYVPAKIPTINAKAKLWITPPPKMNKITTTINVVREVNIVRPRVSLMLEFITLAKGSLLIFLRFSLIRS